MFGGWCFRYEPHRPDQLDHGGNLRGCAAVEADVGRSRANPAFEANTDAGSVVALRMSALLEAAGLAEVAPRLNGPVFANEIVVADLIEPPRAVHPVDVGGGEVFLDGRGAVVDDNMGHPAIWQVGHRHSPMQKSPLESRPVSVILGELRTVVFDPL